MKRFSSLRTEKRQVISSYTMLLKFVHDIHGSNYILCPALRENFGLNLRARISSVRKTLKSKFHKLIAKYIRVSPVTTIHHGSYPMQKMILSHPTRGFFCEIQPERARYGYASLFSLSIPIPLEQCDRKTTIRVIGVYSNLFRHASLFPSSIRIPIRQTDSMRARPINARRTDSGT